MIEKLDDIEPLTYLAPDYWVRWETTTKELRSIKSKINEIIDVINKELIK